MSNNVATNTKNEGRCSFSRKALSVATAAVLATSMVPMLPAESAWAESTESTTTTGFAATATVDGKAVGSYTGEAQEILVTMTVSEKDFDTSKDYAMLLTQADSKTVLQSVSIDNFSYDVEGNAVATAVFSVKDAGKYDVYLNAAGDSNVVADAITIDKANFTDCEFELTSDTYAKGETPKVSKITLNGNDVTKDLEGKYELVFFNKEAANVGTDRVDDITSQTSGTYYAKLQLKDTVSTGNIQGSQYEKTPVVKFALTDATAPEVAFANGKAVAGVDQDGKAVEADEKGAFSVVSDKENALYVIPTSIVPEGGKEVAVEPVDAKNLADSIYADTNKDGKFSAGDQKIKALSDLTAAGKYFVAVQAKDQEGVYAGAVCYVPLNVKAFAYDTVIAVNNEDETEDAENTSFVYSGLTYKDLLDTVGFAIDGEYVDATSSARLFTSAGAEVTSDSKNTAPAGTYTVVDSIDGTDVEATFTLEKLDLSKAVVVAKDVKFGSNNAAYTDTLNSLLVNNKGIASGGSVTVPGISFSVSPITKVGSYKATVSATEGQSNVTGSATVDFNVVSDIKLENAGDNGSSETGVVNYLTYADVAWDANSKDSNDDWSWDVRTFSATGSNTFDAGLVGLVDSLEDEDYTVTVLDKEGNEVSGALKANEKYTVVVRIVPNSEYEVGGTFTREIKVEDGDLADCDVTVTYKGDVVEGVSADYTGKNVIDDVAVTVKDGKKTLTEGVEYELVLKNAKGEVVEEAVESGPYTLVVNGLTYSGSVSIPVAVGDMEVTGLRVNAGDKGVVAWTGEAVTPVIEYTLDSQAKIDAGTAEWTVLPADFYVAKYVSVKTGKAVSEVVDEGEYDVTITPSTKVENMTFEKQTKRFAVSKTVANFVDVSTSAWYADVVAKANTLEYMTGISGTAMFAPNATITRAEVAEVFSKMAKIVKDDSKTYPTKFVDVEADAWYAQAIAWASQAGIVGGYEGTDVFGTFDNATREQIATMIYRYAAVAGMDTTVEDEAKALSAYSDAGQLTFGKTAMAWCVEQGIMGVDTDSLRPGDYMSRAEMAATAVRVQPEAIA